MISTASEDTLPEGDTIYKLAAALELELCGVQIKNLRIRRLNADALVGYRISSVSSEGKYLLMAFDNGHVLRSHLGLYGSWHRYRREEPWRKSARQASILLETEGLIYVCFNVREVEILRSQGYRLTDARRRLGPDLIREQPEAASVYGRATELLAPDTPLVDVLLDQRVAAGIGNVYKSEILFLEAQPPLRSLGSTPVEVLGNLYVRARDLLRRNLHGGPRMTRFAADGRGVLWVYERSLRPCLRCGTPIRRERIGIDSRSTYWCPRCQAPERPAVR